MALGRVSVKIRDGGGYETSTACAVFIPDTATLTQISTAVGVWAALLNNVTSGVITNIQYHADLGLAGVTPNAGTGSILNHPLGLSFPLADVPGRADFVVPALNTALEAGGRPIATEGGAIDLLADHMEAAFTVATTGDSNFTDRQGNAFAAAADPFLADRKFGSALRRRGRAVGV